MAAVKKIEAYTEGQVNEARRLIELLKSVPEERQPLFTAVATAYIDGMETGARIARELKGAAV